MSDSRRSPPQTLMAAFTFHQRSRLHGGVGVSVRRPHRVVKHQVVPADGGQGVGAAALPGDALHEVLVLAISESAGRRRG